MNRQEGGRGPSKRAPKNKSRAKKQADLPRRPLSAYNLFFRDCKELLVEQRKREGQDGRELFRTMAKTIAERWKRVSDVDRKRYTRAAEADARRYKSEMESYYRRRVHVPQGFVVEQKEADSSSLGRFAAESQSVASSTISDRQVRQPELLRSHPFAFAAQPTVHRMPPPFQDLGQPSQTQDHSLALRQLLEQGRADRLQQALRREQQAGMINQTPNFLDEGSRLLLQLQYAQPPAALQLSLPEVLALSNLQRPQLLQSPADSFGTLLPSSYLRSCTFQDPLHETSREQSTLMPGHLGDLLSITNNQQNSEVGYLTERLDLLRRQVEQERQQRSTEGKLPDD